ncbi:MAG: hypothetical protein HFI63_09935 [Lachnospiraceae bacterium]|nr:hypothetical protein [Lachnospiraceae bacterium]
MVITGRDFSVYSRRPLKFLQSCGCEVFDYSESGFGSGSSEEEVIRAARNAEAVIVGMEPYNKRVLSQCKNLRLISRRGVGYDNIDLEECGRRGAAVDVFLKEPCTDSPLIGLENVILTPHTTPYTEENFVEMNQREANNVVNFLEGKLEERDRLI